MSEVRKAATALKGNPVDLVGKTLKPGSKAPDFKLQSPALGEVKLGDFAGKSLVLWTVPSLDTSVCSTETKKFSEFAKSKGNVGFLCVSMDLPFAQARWRAAEGVGHETLSRHRSEAFGRAYGVLLREWRLLQRAVFVIDGSGQIVHAEYVADQMAEPDYDAAVAAARSIASQT